MNTDVDILNRLAKAIVIMDEDEAQVAARQALDAGIPPEEIILKGLSQGIEKASRLFEEQEYFVPEMVVCADTMYAALKIIRPGKQPLDNSLGKIVLGVVEGDTHDIGKNIVGIMLEGAGFEVIDLGRNVPLKDFTDKAIETGADIVALSSLLTTTMLGMKTVIEDIQERIQKSRPWVMVGGAPLSQHFADGIGADGYSGNASEAVRLAKSLMQRNRTAEIDNQGG